MPATQKILWSAEEDEYLVKLRLLGYTNQQIADAIGRPRSTVGHRLLKLMAKHSPQALQEIRSRSIRKPPVDPAPRLRLTAISMRAVDFWTPELDCRITEMRQSGLSFAKIAKQIGKHESTVWDRLMALADRKNLGEQPLSAAPNEAAPRGRADFFRRPDGPIPDKPDVAPNPRKPAYRKCLSIYHRGVPHFWSPSAAVRICPTCKKNASRLYG